MVTRGVSVGMFYSKRRSDLRVSVLRQVSSAPMAKHQCGNPEGSHAGIEQAERSVCCANANEITFLQMSVWSVFEDSRKKKKYGKKTAQ